MKLRPLLLGLVGVMIGWLEPQGDDATDLVRRPEAESSATDDWVLGSRAHGFHSEGAHFYTWQRERSEVVAWVSELAPFDHPAPPRRS